MASGSLENRFCMFDGVLIIVIEKVHHHAAPAHLLKGGERLFHPPAERGLMHPRPKSHVFRVRVPANSGQVEPRAGARDVGVRSGRYSQLRLVIPGRDRLFIGGERMGGDAVARAKINVLFRHLQ